MFLWSKYVKIERIRMILVYYFGYNLGSWVIGFVWVLD